MFWSCLLVACCLGDVPSDEIDRFKPIYGNSAGHPWDVLHETFYVRRFTTGETYYHRLSFHPPWDRFSPFVQREEVFETVIHQLAAVERMPREQMEDADPIRRLIFFRDLWAVFENIWVAPVKDDAQALARRDEIRGRLAQIMKRLELTEREIVALPDTLSLLRAKQDFPETFNPKDPDRPFLPTNLLDDASDWVTFKVGKRAVIGAPRHQDSVNQRSLFTVHLLVPKGRKTGEELLAESRKQFLRTNSVDFPTGTIRALLRRAVAASTEGKLIVTNVVESVQLIVTLGPGVLQDHRQKFVLDRSDFLAGKPGLRRLTLNTPVDAFSFEGAAFGMPFEPRYDKDGEMLVFGSGTGRRQESSLNSCFMCHGPRSRTLYANSFAGAIGGNLSDNVELARHLETTKAASDGWREYLKLRATP